MLSHADAIIAISETGKTGTMLSGFRPACPIYVITANEKTYRQMAIEHNIYPVLVPNEYNFVKILSKGIEILKSKDLIKKDDVVILSDGLPSKDLDENLINSHGTGTILKI